MICLREMNEELMNLASLHEDIELASDRIEDSQKLNIVLVNDVNEVTAYLDADQFHEFRLVIDNAPSLRKDCEGIAANSCIFGDVNALHTILELHEKVEAASQELEYVSLYTLFRDEENNSGILLSGEDMYIGRSSDFLFYNY